VGMGSSVKDLRLTIRPVLRKRNVSTLKITTSPKTDSPDGTGNISVGRDIFLVDLTIST